MRTLFTPHRLNIVRRFGIWTAINAVFLLLFYLRIHALDQNFYLTTSILSFGAMLVYSSTAAVLVDRKNCKMHLCYLFLPYLAIAADLLNSLMKNLAYFLSQYFIIFTGTAILLQVHCLLPAKRSQSLLYRCFRYGFEMTIHILLFLCLLMLINVLCGNTSFDYDAIIAVCQTNFSEAAGYFRRLRHRHLLILAAGTGFVLLCASFACSITRADGRISKNAFVSRIGICLLSTVFFCAILMLGQSRIYPSNLLKLLSSPGTYFYENRKFKAERKNYEQFVREKLSDEPKSGIDGIFVLIIGESLNKHYMEIYGYTEHPTTPFQKKLQSDDSIIVFEYAYSPYAQTIRCLSYMLTNQNQYVNKHLPLRNAVSLFDIAKYNGFHTRWFSAQGAAVLMDSPTAVIVQSADDIFNLPEVRATLDHAPTDWDLLKFLPDQLHARELIVIQLLGSHYPYEKCYPPGYLKGSAMSSYEKSVHYNDMVVQHITSYFREKGAAVICYLSDHSEDVASGIGHDPRPGVFNQLMTEIPLWIYIAADFLDKEENAKLAAKTQRLQNRVITTDLLFDFFLGLMQIQSSFTTAKNNILEDSYFLNKNNAYTLGGTYRLKID
jgi:glucan phosphoethanolaminetransferase (alkaline phosphatase superfamily)